MQNLQEDPTLAEDLSLGIIQSPSKGKTQILCSVRMPKFPPRAGCVASTDAPESVFSTELRAALPSTSFANTD